MKAKKISSKKKTGRRLVVVTDRDMDIFRMLSSGPAAFAQIKIFMEKIYRRKMTNDVLRKRLSKLKAGGYLDSRSYSSREFQGRFSLYALTALSVRQLVKAGYPAGSLRTRLPDDFALEHEMLVTDAVRAIKREGARTYEFQLTDKHVLREVFSDSKKNRVFPDLHVRLALDIKDKTVFRSFDIEIDDITVLPAKVIERAAGFKKPFLILCTLAQRITALKRTFAAYGNPGMSEQVFFGMLQIFVERGFSGTDWINAKGEKVSILNIG